MIEPLNKRHVTAACLLHIEALPDGFLPMLGQDFLKILYHGMLEHGLGFGFVYTIDDKVVGFALASKDTSQLFREIVRKKWYLLAPAVFKKIIRAPSILMKIFETLSYPSKGSNEGDAELLVIAVDKDYRGKRIGSELISSLNDRFMRENINEYKVSVYSDNKNANEFYKSIGFRFGHSLSMYQKEFNVFKYDLAKKDKENI